MLATGSQPDTPIQVILYFKDDAFNGNAVYAQGDSQTSSNLLANCDTPSVARVGGVPSKCVSSITIIKVGPDKTKKVVVNVDSGSDPTISKK